MHGSAPPVKLLRLRSSGMFSNVNEVVEQLRLAEMNGYKFAIDWATSCYRDAQRGGDPWEYYFERCFEVPVPDPGPDVELLCGRPIACSRENIITPRLRDGDRNPLLLPRDRMGAHDIISRFIRLKPQVEAGVDSFQAIHFRPRMIGLHIRGPGRVDGGVPELRRRFGEGGGVPVEAFFQQTDEALRLLPDAGILACSDSSDVIDAVLKRYGERVVVWPALRSTFGEMHANHKKNNGLTFDPCQLGLDVLSEAFLLSRTDTFVHGNSNVANFVLCKSPLMPHAYVLA